MGSQSEEIFRTSNLKQTEVDSYEVVKAKFEKYFIPTRNVIYDRYKFNMRMQKEDEAVEDFITALHNLAQNCKFPPSFGDEAIRDRIVCGIRDKRVSGKLQLEADLTPEKAINIAKQAEIIKKQQRFVTNYENKIPNSADKITAKQIPKFIPEEGEQNVYSKREIQRSRNGNKTQISKFRENCSKTETQCKWCGNSKVHSKEQCPAKNAICNACKKKGHYSRVYRSHLKVNALTEEENICYYHKGSVIKSEFPKSSRAFRSFQLKQNIILTYFLELFLTLLDTRRRKPWHL
ncbi:hypothetical protein AVEN_157987-1 [Araneus ventricosus]|uniref:Retrotransposon gag domain-containing protein n=1 Tax=Araneus ventricosus TaxID=182803 RepID=A0A4Y2SFM9_ARAVE|nr:hypothetical protein AVEN_157987-1 [Araneus ventricosus]